LLSDQALNSEPVPAAIVPGDGERERDWELDERTCVTFVWVVNVCVGVRIWKEVEDETVERWSEADSVHVVMGYCVCGESVLRVCMRGIAGEQDERGWVKGVKVNRWQCDVARKG
jgi:hypothetical protein